MLVTLVSGPNIIGEPDATLAISLRPITADAPAVTVISHVVRDDGFPEHSIENKASTDYEKGG